VPRTALSKIERAQHARIEKERLERDYAAACAERDRKRKEDDERAEREFRERRDAANRLERELADAARRTEKAHERKNAKRREFVLGGLLERHRQDPAYQDLYADVVRRLNDLITKNADRAIFQLEVTSEPANIPVKTRKRPKAQAEREPELATSVA